MAGDLSLALPRAGSLDQFIRTASLAPYLSEQEEHDLAVRLHEQGDLEAARTLVLSHLRYGSTWPAVTPATACRRRT